MGEVLALGSAFCFGLSNVFASKAIAKTDRDVGLLITLLVNVIISSVALLVYLLVSSFLGRMFLFEGIEYIGSARTSGLKLSAPIFSIFKYMASNRNKRSMAVSLKSENGREIITRLLQTSDVVVENFMPVVADKLGIGYFVVSAINPEVVCCSLSGFGQTGPLRYRPGFDMLVSFSIMH